MNKLRNRITVRVTLILSKGASLVACTLWFDKLTMTFVHYASIYKQSVK